MTTDIAIRRKLTEFIHEYEEKSAAIPEALETFERAGKSLKSACSVNGTYGQERIETGSNHERTLQLNLRKSAWLTVYNVPGMKQVMTAKDRKKFDRFIADPSEFTMENIKEQFGDYVLDPWGSILRGLAEVFSDLDQSFKSHEKVKIGVDGLPKRIIISGFGGYSSYGWEKLADVVNALASLRNEPMVSHWTLKNNLEKDGEYYMKDHYDDQGDEVINDKARGFELRLFKNGNGHLHFTPDTLTDINRALAQFYGEVLPDCHEAKPEKRAESTEVSKDLQYYPTPMEVVDRVLGDIYIQEGDAILEPSCGCGRFMDGIRKNVAERNLKDVRQLGIEVDAARAEEAKAKGHKVLIANFLQTEPEARFSKVIMNPPFYGKHYAKHIKHAMKFLKEGGDIYSILPITAKVDHGLIEKMGFKHQWRDLPVGSFRESGTNINTTILTMIK